MGLWRDAFIEAYDARIDDIAVRQTHEAGRVTLSLAVSAVGEASEAEVTLCSPDGSEKAYELSLDGGSEIEIEAPELWWPNGLGEQALYTLRFALASGGEILDTAEKRIGLRTLTVSREADEYGEEFCACVNGVKFFSMGADYVPEDSILPHRTRERTRALLLSCKEANFNAVRVWGGGYYPDDCFYDICDEYGLVVWQDFMFACMNVLMTEEFEKNVRAEFRDVLRRIRHHASIGLLCGNNEMELALIEWSTCLRSKTQKVVDDYLLLYENVLPEVCAEHAPDIFYWPASPSSHGGFDDPNSENVGDAHYWQVWHGGVPFEEYRKHYFRYCSEFGFEAFPSMKTLESFASAEDMRIDSDVMRAHQKCLSGNEKIMSYINDYYKVPEKFEDFVYISQLLQADAIRYGAEHFRRHRGRCMGALYWQLNDCWPTVSWASVDYFGRWKALHHKAKAFFAPVLLSLHEDGEEKIANISNETREDFVGEIYLAVRDNSFCAIAEHREKAHVHALSAKDFAFPEEISAAIRGRETELFLEYALICDGKDVCREAKIYAKPKDYLFENPQISANLQEENGEFYLNLRAEKFAKCVMLEWKNADVRAEENFFDITCGSKTVRLIGKREDILSEMPKIVSVYDV
jgi:beta-mannosidase